MIYRERAGSLGTSFMVSWEKSGFSILRSEIPVRNFVWPVGERVEVERGKGRREEGIVLRDVVYECGIWSIVCGSRRNIGLAFPSPLAYLRKTILKLVSIEIDEFG